MNQLLIDTNLYVAFKRNHPATINLLRHASSINIITGQGAYEAPEASRSFARLLDENGIPHTLDVWSEDGNHDWPWWRKMLPYYIEKLGW